MRAGQGISPPFFVAALEPRDNVVRLVGCVLAAQLRGSRQGWLVPVAALERSESVVFFVTRSHEHQQVDSSIALADGRSGVPLFSTASSGLIWLHTLEVAKAFHVLTARRLLTAPSAVAVELGWVRFVTSDERQLALAGEAGLKPVDVCEK